MWLLLVSIRQPEWYDGRLIGAFVRRLHLPGKWRSIGPKSNTYIHLIYDHRYAEVISEPNRENTIKRATPALFHFPAGRRRLQLPRYRLKLVCLS